MHTNDLINETSPYLLQHAHNPVNWKAWNDKTLAEAEELQKLIIVSVGYAACHWCHVMEKESFEDTEVAHLMNDNYISIKVDREERPDVDQVYMDAAQLITGRGGWPLNIIALPDGRPIYAGTYFTKQQWLKVLSGVVDFYKKTPEKALEQAMQVAAGIKKMNFAPEIAKSTFRKEVLEDAARDWLNSFDIKEGGRAGQVKFPMPTSYLTLLRFAVATQNKRALSLVRLTLDKMASGGIYDQIGGGFSRYSVDPYWHVPHFEKMLYDNAQLITLYSEAYKHFKDPFYLQIVEETVSFCESELKAEDGGYISSIDADSEGEEGKFYCWSAKEIDALLLDDADLFKRFYGVRETGNWENGKNVLKMSANLQNMEEKFNLGAEEIGQKLKRARETLFEARNKRVRPSEDDKILTSWNALMITGLTHAYEASGVEKYRDLALELANFIWANVWTGESLQRSFKNGEARINAFLDDYAFLISGFIRLYSATFDTSWLDRANKLMSVVFDNFQDNDARYFNFKSKLDANLIVKKQVLEDNVIPSGNAEMAKNLYQLGLLLDKNEFIQRSESMTLALETRILEHAAFYYNWFDSYAARTGNFLEVAIVGEDWQLKRQELTQYFIPYALILGGCDENLPLLKGKVQKSKTLYYICIDKVCAQPLEHVDQTIISSKYQG